MSEYMVDLIAASIRMRGFVRFTVANGMAADGDLAVMRKWLDALERVECGGERKGGEK